MLSITPDEQVIFESHIWLAKCIARRYSNLSSRQIAFDDLHQECLMGLLRAIKGYKASTGNTFQSYATAVIARSARAYIRREGRQFQFRESDAHFALYDLPTNDAVHEPEYDKEHFGYLMSMLPQNLQRVITMRVIDNKSNQEIGQVLGVNSSRASQLWKQAIQRLRDSANLNRTNSACI